uniref:Uncharacterized protein n=1 Tax=Cacopsylla melanoneura TaxID=428564 RepID=A0A8D8QQK2_9HEMI
MQTLQSPQMSWQEHEVPACVTICLFLPSRTSHISPIFETHSFSERLNEWAFLMSAILLDTLPFVEDMMRLKSWSLMKCINAAIVLSSRFDVLPFKYIYFIVLCIRSMCMFVFKPAYLR